MRLTNYLHLPNVVKKKLNSNGVLVEWAKDGRKMISYPSSHKYYSKLGINQVEIVPQLGFEGGKTVNFFRDGKVYAQGWEYYSPSEKAINPNGNGLVGNLQKLMSDMATQLYSK